VTTFDYDAVAAEAGLERVGARPPLHEYLAQLWERRQFAFTLSRFRIQAGLAENRLGLGWVVLRPTLNALMYGLIFGLILPASSRPPKFIPFLVAGVFIFEYFSRSLNAGARAVSSNASLVRSLSFPRMLLPLASVLQQLFELIPMVTVMCLIFVFMGEPVTWTWLLLVPVLLLMTLFNLGVALVTARLTVHLHDITQVIPIITRLLFYSSGIFYSLDLVLDKHQTLLEVAKLNPVYAYIALVRGVTLSGHESPGSLWWVAAIAAVVALAVGVVFFWRAEERYGRD